MATFVIGKSRPGSIVAAAFAGLRAQERADKRAKEAPSRLARRQAAAAPQETQAVLNAALKRTAKVVAKGRAAKKTASRK